MKFCLFITVILSIFVPKFINAENYSGPIELTNKTDVEEIQIIGPSTLKKVKTSYLNVTGPLEFEDLEVTGYTEVLGTISNSHHGKFKELSVIGPVDAQMISADEITVIGPVNISNLDVAKTTNITGPAKIVNARLQNLEITSNQIVLDNVNVTNITIKEDKHTAKKQTLYLQGATTVKGDINFISGKGVVDIKGDKVRTLGKITGVVSK